MGLTVKLRDHAERYAVFQYFWLIILLPKALQLVALGGLMCLTALRTDRKIRLDRFTLLQFLCLGLYALSIVVNTIMGGHELNRIAAAGNTWAINLVALAFYIFYRHIRLDYHRLGKYCFINLLILIGLWVIFELTDGAKITIFGQMLSDDDWINGVLDMRFMGFLDYSNLVIFCILYFYPLALVYLSGKPVRALVLTMALFPVISATNSRTGLVLLAVLFVAYILFELQKVFFQIYRRHRPHTWLLGILAVALVLVVSFDLVTQAVDKIMSLRTGSNSMRIYLYTHSLTRMLKESPIIGIGIKDMLSFGADGYAVQYYALGSHSTYLGMFYKIGILGGTLYLISMILVTVRILKNREKDSHLLMLKVCLAATLLMMALEDIDGANWSICICYILLALVQNPGWNTEKGKERLNQ